MRGRKRGKMSRLQSPGGDKERPRDGEDGAGGSRLGLIAENHFDFMATAQLATLLGLSVGASAPAAFYDIKVHDAQHPDPKS